MEQQTPQPNQLKPSQQLAYKRVVAENKRLKEQVQKLKDENEILHAFIGDKR